MPNITLDSLQSSIREEVRRALAEDIGSGDITAALIPAERQAQATIISREPAILCGTAWADEVFRQIDPAINVQWLAADGEPLLPNEPFCQLSGPARGLLSGERCALNFIQTLSATATRSRYFADMVEGTQVKLLDTRKTLPGLRLAQKYAVRAGGGANHRIGLFDAVMLKENHVRVAGSVAAAIQRARESSPGLPLIVEVETLAELREALQAGCDRILIDDFTPGDRREAVRLAAGAPFDGRIPLEVSGSVDLDSVGAVAADGVDFISIGALTKHVRAIDLSMKLGPCPA